jgi:hypothetical protein
MRPWSIGKAVGASVRIGRPALLATTAALILAIAGVANAGDYAGAPWLLYRDANPFVAASGLPFTPPTAAPDSWHVDAIFGASNTELAFDRGTEHLVYDAETHEARLAVTRAFGERWLARATLGSVAFGDGFLDSFLQNYHRIFGFSNGDRGRLGSNGHTISYTDANGREVFLDRSLHAITPLVVDLAARTPGDGYEWLYGTTLKLPASHASPLVDDRAVDLSAWLAAQSTDANARLPWGVRIGVMRQGETQLLPQRARELVSFADATFGYVLLPGCWDVAAQLQWHGALYESEIPLLESAATLALSSAWHARAGWNLRAGLIEDAIPRHAQDVTFFIGLSL